MQGVILAAGIGSRLRPMTDQKPKCLVKVAGKPMLEYQLESYRQAGIKDVIIVVGYKGDQIEHYCRYIHDLNITIVKNDEYEETNNMYSLYLAKDLLYGKPFILNNADLVIEKDIIQNMVESTKEDLVAVDVGLYNDESMKISCDELGYIKNISKKISKEQSVGCSIDFYKISQKVSQILFDEIKSTVESGNRKDWTEVALQKVFSMPQIYFEIMNVSGKKWVEIDNNEDLNLADKYFSQLDKKITDYQCYLFDLDGTVYVGDTPIAKSVQSILYLQAKGKTLRFLSNNSSKSKKEYVKRLERMGIDCVEGDIVLSTDATIQFLHEKMIKKIYVLGTKNLKQILMDEGFEISDQEAEIVVVGYDTELSYEKLVQASKLINSGVDYVATHRDVFCPTEFGPIPDIGTLIATLEMTTGIKPLRVFGKPDLSMIEHLSNQLDVDKKDMIMIGDRLHTDILMSNNYGIDSLLVLSGETTRLMADNMDTQVTYILNEFDIFD